MSRALLLLGSPKATGSTSASLLEYLGARLAARGWTLSRVHLNQTMTLARTREDLFTAVDRADLVVLAFPLYIDGIPTNALRAMEALADRPWPSGGGPRPPLAVIVNSGFPEAAQSETARATCREFAREAGFPWRGALALGGGGAVGGRPLERTGAVGRNIRASLDLAAEALGEGKPIPDRAVARMAKPIVSAWLYRRIGDVGWRRLARKYGVSREMRSKPYKDRGTVWDAASPRAIPDPPKPPPRPRLRAATSARAFGPPK